jgi:hypothetical protein
VILIPFTHEIPEETSVAILDFPHVLAFMDDDTAYWTLLAGWWKSDEPDIVIIEHDIGVSSEAISTLLACEHPWCASTYPFEGGEIHGLGFTKFSLPIRQAVPDALDIVAAIEQPGVHPAKHWCSLDAWLQGTLGNAGHTPHVHSLPIHHFNSRRSHIACR